MKAGKRGKVFLVGAGPGDPGLLTLKGLDCLRQADVVVYDRLLDDRILREVHPGAEKIYVGKSAQHHSLEQEEINRLLVKKAQQGKMVVRLKGGDPFVLGRGGEEAQALSEAGVSFEVVPGISAAVAVPAYAGIPVTHRHLASSFAVITGHKAVDHKDSDIAWDKLSTGVDTLVFLMAVENLAYVVDRLLENGRPSTTPAAVIADGTSHRQRTVVGRLGDIVSQTRKADIQPPAVLVVGEVVRLREHLRWFDNCPLFGKRVLITRPKHQAGQFSQLLLKCGAVPVEIPVIQIRPSPVPAQLEQAILDLKDYHWVIFTSVNGVDAFFNQLGALDLDARWLHGLRLGAIGPSTARALESRGLRADCVPKKYTTPGLLAQLKQYGMAGSRVLLPRADIAGKQLASGLARMGAEVRDVIAYRTTPDSEGASQAKEMLSAGEIDIITFTSASTVTNLVAAVDKDIEMLNKAVIACIGPETASAAASAGLRVDIAAQKHTLPGLIEAMEQYFQRGEK